MGMFDGRLLVCATTFPTRDEAEDVVARLVAERLVVCGQVGADLTSYYRWEGELQRQSEVAVMLKIRDDKHALAMARLRELHPYDVPQLVSWSATHVDAAYASWAWEEES